MEDDFTTEYDLSPEEEAAFLAGWNTECFILGNPNAQYDTSAFVGSNPDLIEAFAAGCDAAAHAGSSAIDSDELL